MAFIDIFIDLCMSVERETVHDLIHEIYSNLHHIISVMMKSMICDYFSQRVILAARNADVDEINNNVLQMLSGDVKIYFSADSAFNDAGVANDAIPKEYLNTIQIPGMPLHQTALKINCPIILLRNLDSHEGLCNDTRLIVTVMTERVIEAQILTDTHIDKKAFISRVSLDTSMSAELGFILRRRQLLIRLEFDMSINKAQRQSLDRVDIYLNNSVFAHSQLYIALLRCTDCRNIRILLLLNAHQTTSNIVYHEVID